MSDVLSDMVEVRLTSDSAFRKIRESLTRMGVSHPGENILWQSCHILHKSGRYFICHFKELIRLDGNDSEILEEDIMRRNLIVRMLRDWGLLEVVDESKLVPMGAPRLVKVIKYVDVPNWELVPKYIIGVMQKVTDE